MPNERSRDDRGSRGAARGASKGGPSKSGPRKPGGAKRGAAKAGGRAGSSGSGRSPRGAKTGRGDGSRADSAPRPGGERGDGERRPPGPDLAGPAQWGRIARGGAGRMESPAIGTEGFDDFPAKRPRKPRVVPDVEGTPVDADGEPTSEAPAVPAEAPEPKKARPERERSLPGADDLERQAAKAVSRSRGKNKAARERKPLGARPQRVEDPAVVLRRLVGPDRAKSLHRKLNEAGRAFEAERFTDARSVLRPVVKEAPDLADGRELMGLILYRLGRWKEAIDQLELFREMTDATEQHPVLADCHRALGRVNDVEFLWQELGEASPRSEVVVEGRIVLAGAYADQGDLAKAIRTLQAGWKPPKRPADHHLRRAYALADLYDRAGKAARARELFKWIAGHDPRFADVKSRVKQLS